MVAAGSWLSRTRSVNIVQQRSNKLKQASKQTKTEKHVKKAPGAALSASAGTESRTCCAQSHRTIVPRARFRSPGSYPRPESGPESAWGQMPRPGTLRMAEQAPVATGDSASRWNQTRSVEVPPPPKKPISLPGWAAHLQLRAHVPPAPGPEPGRRVVPAAARPSVSAPLKSPRSTPQGRGGPCARPRKRLGSAEGFPGPHGDGAMGLPAWIPGGRTADQWEREPSTWGAPGGAPPPPGARLPAAGGQFASPGSPRSAFAVTNLLP